MLLRSLLGWAVAETHLRSLQDGRGGQDRGRLLLLLLLLLLLSRFSHDTVRLHRRQPTRLPRPWDSPGKNTGVGCHFLLQCMKVKTESEVAQSCRTLSDPMSCSPPGSSVHGIFQARVLEWVAIAFSDKRGGVKPFMQGMCTALQGSTLRSCGFR